MVRLLWLGNTRIAATVLIATATCLLFLLEVVDATTIAGTPTSTNVECCDDVDCTSCSLRDHKVCFEQYPYYREQQQQGHYVCIPTGNPERVKCCLDSDCSNCVSIDSSSNCVQHYPYFVAAFGDGQCKAARTDIQEHRIRTWNGTRLDLNGECDFVLLRATDFEPDKSLSIVVRTTRMRNHPVVDDDDDEEEEHLPVVVSTAALRIGHDILQVTSWGKYALNGVIGDAEWDGGVLDIAGFPIYHSRADDNDDRRRRRHVFDIIIGNEENITFSTYTDHVNVEIVGGTRDHFGQSQGLMGTFSGHLLARDGTTMMVMDVDQKDAGDLLEWEWQARLDESTIFRSLRDPQYPSLCRTTTSSNNNGAAVASEATDFDNQRESLQQQRGDETIPSVAHQSALARKACSHLPPGGVQFDKCLFDAISDGDIHH